MAVPLASPRIRRREHPLSGLAEDDLDFIVQFVLSSGSLKEMAERYGVSYPTIRASLDRVIENLRMRINGETRDEMTEMLAGLMERGELNAGAARRIRALHRSLLEQAEEDK
jgi:hypothetical protein